MYQEKIVLEEKQLENYTKNNNADTNNYNVPGYAKYSRSYKIFYEGSLKNDYNIIEFEYAEAITIVLATIFAVLVILVLLAFFCRKKLEKIKVKEDSKIMIEAMKYEIAQENKNLNNLIKVSIINEEFKKLEFKKCNNNNNILNRTI